MPDIPDYINHAAYKCYVFVENGKRDEYINSLNEAGVPCSSGSCSEVYLEKAFENTNYCPQVRLVNAKKLGESSIAFLCHPSLKQDEIDKTCQVIRHICE